MILYSEVITEKIRILKEAKEQAEQENKQLEAVITNIDIGIVVIDMKGEVIHANDALAKILGYRDKYELPLNTNVFESLFLFFSYPERNEIPPVNWLLNRLLRGEAVANEKCIIRRLDTGRERIVEHYGTLIRNTKGTPELQLLMITDITDRQRAEEVIRETKEFAEQEKAKWLAVLDHISNGVAVFDVSTNQIYANQMHQRMYGLMVEETQLSNEFISSNYVVQTYPGGEKPLPNKWPALRVLGGERLVGEAFSVKRLDKEFERIMMLSGVPIYNNYNKQGEVELAVIVSSDITEQVAREKHDKLMQERMAQTQRLESLGVLAGGIAHDFNNLLMAILGHAEIALLKLSHASPMATNLENIKTASLRAADLCTQLLAYSGQGKIENQEFSISRLVSEIAQMLKTSVSKSCYLNLNLNEQLPMMVGDPSQIRQIIMNFVINASDAIGHRSGTINISTSSMNCPPEYFTDDYLIKPVASSPYVTLVVSDNGPGMDKETLERIFEPFFTTKFAGRGLGLSAVLGIIRSHGAGLMVVSEPGVGTTFKVFFSAIQSREEEVPGGIKQSIVRREHFVGTVLLVDDEEIVCSVCSSQLEMLGLEALIAKNGLEGVEIYRQKKEKIDLVILDLTMPQMGGKETFRILRQLNPEVKVVLASGYAEHELPTLFADEKPSDYLRKPYTLKQLSRVNVVDLTDWFIIWEKFPH